MPDSLTNNGSLLLNTDPTSVETALSVSRSDAGMTSADKSLAKITMSGAAPNSFVGVMTFSTTNTNVPSAVPVERMRIHSNGNIGIGATNPAVKFAVGGNGVNVNSMADMWVENNICVQGAETLTAIGGRSRLRVGSAWGYAGIYSDGSSNGAGNDLVLGASSGTVRIGPEGTGQSLRVCGGLFVAAGATVNGSFLRVTGAGNEQAYIGGDGVSADINIGSFNPQVSSVGFWNYGSNSIMDLIAGNFRIFSDRRLKDNIEPIADSLQKVCKLNGVSYEMAEGKGPKGRRLGLIAQEVAAVAPEAVSSSRGLFCVDYPALTSVLIEAVKELSAQVAELQRQLPPAPASR